LRRAVIVAVSRHYSGHVEVNRVTFRVGGGLVVKGLQLRADADPKSHVICEIPRIELEGSAWEVIRGKFRPTAVSVRKPILRVRRGVDGNWLHHLPILIPTKPSDPLVPVEIRDASIEFQFAGAPPSDSRKVTGLQMTVRAADTPGIQFAGSIADPIWSEWRFSGSFQAESCQLKIHAQSDSIQLTPEHADWLPTDHARVGRSLEPAGRLTVAADITWDSNSHDLGYHLLIDPTDVSLRIPTISERIRDVTGRIELTTKSVRAHSLIGRLGSGEILASGTITRETSPRFDVDIELRRVPLAEVAGDRLKGAGQVLDSVTGKLNLVGYHAPQTWTGSFDGSLRLARAEPDETVPLHLSIDDGVLQLSDLELRLGGGLVTASARTPIHEDGVAEGRVVLEAVDLNAIGALTGQQMEAVAGAAAGELTFNVPIRAWSDGTAWSWTGPIELQNVRFGKLLFDTLDGKLTCRQRVLTLDGATGTIKTRTLRGNVRLDLSPPFNLLTKFRVDPFDLTKPGPQHAATGTAPLVTGLLDATGTVQGTLKPYALQVAGVAYVQRLTVGRYKLGDTASKYSLAGDGFDLHGADVDAFGGKIRLTGRWRWLAEQGLNADAAKSAANSEKRTQHLSLRANAERIDLAMVTPRISNAALELRGRAGGNFQIECPLKPVNGELQPQITGSIEAARLSVGTVDLENARASVQFSGATLAVPDWSATLDGATISGSANIDQLGTSPRLTAQVNATGLELADFIRPPAGGQKLARVRGSAAGRLAIRWESETGLLQGQGTARLTSVVVPGLPPIDSITTSKLELRDSRLTLRACQASAWGGTGRGMATINLSKTAERIIDVELERVEQVDFARLAAGWPMGRAEPRGKLSGAGKFHVPGNAANRVVFGTGEFKLETGSVFGLPVAQASGTLDAWDASSHEIVSGRLQQRRNKPARPGADPRLLIQIADAKAARGNLHGAVVFALTRPINYDTNLRFSDLDLTTVARAMFKSQQQVSGVLSGELQLHGSEHGLPDLRGEFRRMRVDDGDLWHLPIVAVVFRDSAKLLNKMFNRDAPGGAQVAEAPRITLANGTLHFDEVRLYGVAGKLIGTGTVGLNGEVDLEVVGNFDAGLAIKVPLIERIQQRLVKFRITGTLDEPFAVPVPLQDLTEPAEKFLRGILTGTLLDDSDPARPMRR
jgi:hypothetical protein